RELELLAELVVVFVVYVTVVVETRVVAVAPEQGRCIAIRGNRLEDLATDERPVVEPRHTQGFHVVVRQQTLSHTALVDAFVRRAAGIGRRNEAVEEPEKR